MSDYVVETATIDPPTEPKAALRHMLANPALLKTQDGDYDDDAPAKWAWLAHGRDTGMEAFYSFDQIVEAIRLARELGKEETA